MADIDDEIRDIKREIIESRNLVIKTSNITNALAADVKVVTKRQAGYERRFSWNGAAAYFLIAAVSFLGLKLASDARVREVESQTVELRRRLNRQQEEMRGEVERAGARARAESAAVNFYRLIREHRREAAVEQFGALRSEALSPAEAAFFRDAVDRFQEELAVMAYEQGLELARGGRNQEAAEAFQRSLRLDEDGLRSPAAQLELASVLRAQGNLGRAKLLAATVAEQVVDRELQDDGLYLFAQIATQSGSLDEAQTALRSYLRRWPRGPYSAEARTQVLDLNRRMVRGQR